MIIITNCVNKPTNKLYNVKNACLIVIMARMDLDQLEGMTCVDIQTAPSVAAFFYDEVSGVRSLWIVLGWALGLFGT